MYIYIYIYIHHPRSGLTQCVVKVSVGILTAKIPVTSVTCQQGVSFTLKSLKFTILKAVIVISKDQAWLPPIQSHVGLLLFTEVISTGSRPYQ